MRFEEFNLLNEIRQTEILIEQGVLVAERFYKELKIMLYQISEFYVEVYYHLSYGVVQGFRCFESTAQLEPYFSEIDIDCLIS
jgi:hypothetical protein